MQKISIVIPAYNEEKSIEKTMEQIHSVMGQHSISYELIIVDDGSTDSTSTILENRNDLILVKHDVNMGYGAALKTGIRNASGEIIAITDADGTYPIADIPKLFGYIEEYDMVVGARTGENVHIPLIRRPAKWLLNKLANFVANYKIPDMNSGLRVFKKDIAESYSHILPSGFSFTATITLAFLCDDYLVKYIPIDYQKRVGKSKIRAVRDTSGFLMLILRTAMYFNPLKVFLPITLFFALCSLAALSFDVFIVHDLSQKSILLPISTILIFAIGLLADLIVKRSS